MSTNLSASILKTFMIKIKQVLEAGKNWKICRVSQKNLTCLAGCEIKSMRPLFKTEKLIYLSNANLDEKTLFGKITHH